MTGLGWPLFRAHARANLVLAVLMVFATALLAGSFTVLMAAATGRYLPGAGTPDDDDVSVVAMSVMGWTLALTIFTGASLVASMTAFTIDARLPEIARLRLTGATGRQVSRSIITEVLAVGLLASLVGAVVGWPVGALIRSVLVRMDFAPPGLDVTPLPWSPAVVVGAGLVVTFFGARYAARRAGRTDPLVAVTDVVPARRAMTPGRWVVAVLGVAGLVGLATVRVTSTDDVFGFTLLTALVAVTALACLAPVLVPAVTRLLGTPLARWWPGPGLLAVEHTRYAVRRTAALALPVLLIVGLSGSLLTILGTANGGPGTDTRADLVVLGAPTPLDPAAAATDGIASVTSLEVLEATAITDQRDADDEPEEEPWHLGAVDVPAAEALGLVTTTQQADGSDGTRTARSGGTDDATRGDDTDQPAGSHDTDATSSAVSGVDADGTRTVPVASTDPGVLPLGATLTVVSDDDPTIVLTVTSVVEADPVLAGDILVDPAFVGPWAAPVDTAAVLTLTADADPAAVRADLTAVTAPAEVLTGTALAQRQTDAADRHNRNAVLAILGGGIVMAGCSIVLGGLSGTADRRREFAVLVRSGATDRQILTSTLVETVLVLTVAAVLAVVEVAWVTWRLDTLLTWADPPSVATGTMGIALAAAAVLALAATLTGTAFQLRRISRE